MGKKLKLSPWHSGNVKPVHVGIYQVYEGIDNIEAYAYWNGEYFAFRSTDFCLAYYKKTYCSCYGYMPTKWRGIIK